MTMNDEEEAPRCPVRGHLHRLLLLTTHGARRWNCPSGYYRWERAGGGLLAALPSAPKVILRTLKPETWNGIVWVRRKRPHWGWPD
jgi:hypothetical protein